MSEAWTQLSLIDAPSAIAATAPTNCFLIEVSPSCSRSKVCQRCANLLHQSVGGWHACLRVRPIYELLMKSGDRQASKRGSARKELRSADVLKVFPLIETRILPCSFIASQRGDHFSGGLRHNHTVLFYAGFNSCGRRLRFGGLHHVVAEGIAYLPEFRWLSEPRLRLSHLIGQSSFCLMFSSVGRYPPRTVDPSHVYCGGGVYHLAFALLSCCSE